MVSDEAVEIKVGDSTEYDQMLRRYDVYDRTVDIVSAFEALFTKQEEIAATVESFYRFPSLTHADGRLAKPDFAVAFKNGAFLVAEIAHLALHENSAEQLCKQLLRYDGLEAPDAVSAEPASSGADVLCLIPAEDLNDATDRIIGQRFANDHHAYKPSRPPVMAGVVRSSDRYSFFRNRDARNGTLRHPLLQQFIDGGFKAPADFWAPVKAEHPFANDPVPELYLATLIWIKVLPVMAEGSQEFTTSADRIATALRRQYGSGRVAEVRAALSLLNRGRFVRPGANKDEVVVRRVRLGKSEPNFPRVLAARAYRPRMATRRRRRAAQLPTPARGTLPGQTALFNTLEEAAQVEESE